MFFSNPKNLGVALAAGVITSVAALPQARGELIYEAAPQQQMAPAQEVAAPPVQVVAPAPVAVAPAPQPFAQPPQVQAAPAPIQVYQAPVQSYQAPVQPQYYAAPAPAPVQMQPQQFAPQQGYAGTGPAASLTNEDGTGMSKSELVRRERLRAELQNEDELQKRLEELRLRDERRRADELVAGQPVGSSQFGQSNPQVVPTTQAVGQLANMQPGQPGLPVQQYPQGYQPMQQDQITTSYAVANNVTVATAPETTEDTALIYVQPRAGVSNFSNVSYFDVKAKYSAGLGLGISVSDNLSFELGYLYSEYGVAMSNSNPYAITAQVVANQYGYSGQFESVTMKQNVADAGLKIHFLPPKAKLRPFIGGGGAYAKSFINFNQQIIQTMNQYALSSPDFDLTQFLGYLSTGFDVRVNKSISIGTMFRYHSVLSSRQNQNFNPYGMYGSYFNPAYSGAYANSVTEADKQKVGNALSQNTFYTVTAGATFVF